MLVQTLTVLRFSAFRRNDVQTRSGLKHNRSAVVLEGLGHFPTSSFLSRRGQETLLAQSIPNFAYRLSFVRIIEFTRDKFIKKT